MGKMKELAIKQEEQQLAELYESANIESIINKTDAKHKHEESLYKDKLLNTQIDEDRSKNKN